MILVITKHLKSYLETFITKKITIDEVERKQDEFNAIMGVLEDYTTRSNKYIEAKNKLLNHVKKIYEGREKLLRGLKTEYFLLIMMKCTRNEWNLKEKKKKKKKKK